MSKPADATVLICTWNRARLLRETLASLARMTPPSCSWDLLVVDNNSTDNTRDVVQAAAQAFPVPLRYVFEARQGKSSAMNTGIRHTSAPLLVFTDDDVLVGSDWLQAAIAPMLADASIGYTGGPVRPIWEAPCPPWFERTGRTLWGTLAILDYGAEPFIFEERQRIPLGANFAMRRSLLERVGGFDPQLGRTDDVRVLLGQELPELFARARAANARGMYVPEMVVDHHVPERRLKPAYCRRWWYGKGVSRARMEALHPITELGLDLRTVATVGGIPRFLFGTAARDAAGWFGAVVRGDVGGRIAHETQLWYFAGQLRERLRLRASGPLVQRSARA